MNSLANEKTMKVAKAIERVLGNRVHGTTWSRWCRDGSHGVRLEYLRCGRECRTSEEAVRRFLSALERAAAEDAERRAERRQAELVG
jgi:RNA binding exosome subunit